MDKKNTMLLTVIAVATLLVAVVGATFAYFTATANTNNTTAGVTATTGTVSTVNLVGASKTLKLDTVVADFEHVTTNKQPYYAVETTNASGYAAVAQNHVLGTVSIEGDGKFNCTYTVTVTADNVPADMKATDGSVVVNGENIDPTTVAISSIGEGKTFTGSWSGLTKAEIDTKITVDAYLVNTNEPQDYLQGLSGDKALKINYSVSAFNCTNVA